MDDKLPDEFVIFTQLLVDDRELMHLFASLKSMPENLRYSVLKKIELKMRNDNQDEKLIAVVKLLSNKDIFNAIWNMLIDIRY